jgi:hypothetical protein
MNLTSLEVLEFTAENFYASFANEHFSAEEARNQGRVVYLAVPSPKKSVDRGLEA